MNDRQDTMPPLAMLMGCGGLIPFSCARRGAQRTLWSGIALFDRGVYGAVILGHRGGPLGSRHAGRSPADLVCLVGGAGALCLAAGGVPRQPHGAAGAGSGFLVSWSVDRRAATAGLLPQWYMRLRHMLTLGASLALAPVRSRRRLFSAVPAQRRDQSRSVARADHHHIAAITGASPTKTAAPGRNPRIPSRSAAQGQEDYRRIARPSGPIRPISVR